MSWCVMLWCDSIFLNDLKVKAAVFLEVMLIERENCFFFFFRDQKESQTKRMRWMKIKNYQQREALRWEKSIFAARRRDDGPVCAVLMWERWERKLKEEGSSVYLSHLSLTSSSVFRVIWSSLPVSSRPGTPCCLCVFINKGGVHRRVEGWWWG